MGNFVSGFILILLAYFLGSIPSAFIVGKLSRNIDIREYGSGNVGATNTLRILGKKWGAVVLFCDMFKGFAAVVFLPHLFIERPSPFILILLVISVVVGHNWTVFLNFKGGKGVATSTGSLLGLGIYNSGFFVVIFIVLLIWSIIFFTTRIVSVSSIIAAAILPVLVYFFSREFFILSLFITLFILVRHIPNIKRFLKGEEKPLNSLRK